MHIDFSLQPDLHSLFDLISIKPTELKIAIANVCLLFLMFVKVEKMQYCLFSKCYWS